jgi:hypothetical protein
MSGARIDREKKTITAMMQIYCIAHRAFLLSRNAEVCKAIS